MQRPVIPADISLRILKTIKKCHEDGFKFINKALEADEKGKPDLTLYWEGCAEFQKGLKIKIPGEGKAQYIMKNLTVVLFFVKIVPLHYC